MEKIFVSVHIRSYVDACTIPVIDSAYFSRLLGCIHGIYETRNDKIVISRVETCLTEIKTFFLVQFAAYLVVELLQQTDFGRLTPRLGAYHSPGHRS